MQTEKGQLIITKIILFYPMASLGITVLLVSVNIDIQAMDFLVVYKRIIFRPMVEEPHL